MFKMKMKQQLFTLFFNGYYYWWELENEEEKITIKSNETLQDREKVVSNCKKFIKKYNILVKK